MILREAWQEVCGGLRGGEQMNVKKGKRGDTSTPERWEQVRGRVGGMGGWMEEGREGIRMMKR